MIKQWKYLLYLNWHILISWTLTVSSVVSVLESPKGLRHILSLCLRHILSLCWGSLQTCWGDNVSMFRRTIHSAKSWVSIMWHGRQGVQAAGEENVGLSPRAWVMFQVCYLLADLVKLCWLAGFQLCRQSKHPGDDVVGRASTWHAPTLIWHCPVWQGEVPTVYTLMGSSHSEWPGTCPAAPKNRQHEKKG